MGIDAVCIHGHFYQPPREDPLSGLVPEEIGAEPFQNWNERIHAECYYPNMKLGNFERASFNIGPTLLSWMEKHDPITYRAIVQQERNNFNKYGIGNGMAQAYHHVILPLASKKDKITQVKWGIADFEHRFGHAPLGMWLPETGVDLETLAVLSDNNIKFTIIAPWQIELHDGYNYDQPYLIELPDNRDPMVVFPYHQDLSTLVSFDSNATRNADVFINEKLVPALDSNKANYTRFLLIASDGEVYGHHKSFREKFLSYMLNGALSKRGLSITYPGKWLLENQPKVYAKLNEYTSWSCHHGITRWMGECECSPGAAWKTPLRWAFDKLAAEINHQYELFIEDYTGDSWQLRDDYIYVLLGQLSLEELLSRFIENSINKKSIVKIAMLLKAQYECQRMFTSCAWFHNHFQRIEPQNNIAYAAQAIWLTKQVTGVDLQPKAIALLKKVKDQTTGLRGDIVFSERYYKTEAYSEKNPFHFNPSSSFST